MNPTQWNVELMDMSAYWPNNPDYLPSEWQKREGEMEGDKVEWDGGRRDGAEWREMRWSGMEGLTVGRWKREE